MPMLHQFDEGLISMMRTMPEFCVTAILFAQAATLDPIADWAKLIGTAGLGAALVLLHYFKVVIPDNNQRRDHAERMTQVAETNSQTLSRLENAHGEKLTHNGNMLVKICEKLERVKCEKL